MQSFQVIEETPQYCVETFGPSLPVLITEVLLQADRSANISVKLDNSGWACLVCDRRLFIWRYKQTQAARIGLCYQLALPATELCHRADLICLIPTGGGNSGADSQMVSVLAVSPEGVVRYWPTAHREIAYSERSLELGGQECFTLTAFGKHQCILATTTNQLMMISVSPSTMQSQVEVHTLKSSQGMIARVSSFLFGAQKDETSGLRRVLAGSAESAGYPLYILQDSILQKWFISGPGQEQVVYEKQLDGLFKQQFQREMGASSMENIKVWLLDIQLISNIAVILAGAVNTSSPNQRIKIAIATLKVQVDTDTPTKLESFVVASTPPQDSDDEGALDKHLLLANPGGPHCYIYSQHSIVCCSGLFDQMPSFQEVGFSKAGDSIRGAGCFDGQAIFFSSNHGVITVNTSQSEMPSFIMDDSRTGQTSRLEQSMQQQSMQQQSMQQSSFTTPSARSRPFQVMSASRSRPDTSILETTGDLEEDKTNGLKMAFLHSCKHDMNKAENLVQDLFLQDTFERGKTNSSLDQAVAKLSRELIDDFPASDPRWAESLPQDSVASTGSLILLHQLEDKMKAHEHLVKFIKDVGIWDMLHSVIVRDLPQTTHNLLSEHAEKLSAARALCNKHVKFQGLIDTAVCRALRKRKQDAVPSGLTPRDIFYREVSKMEDIVEALMEEEQDLLSSGLTPQDTVSLISSINTIIQSVLQEAWHLHQSRSLVYQSHNEASGTSLPFIPWIASSGPRGIRMQLVQQHNLTVGRAVANAEDAQSRSGLFQQLQSITDLLLEGYIAQLESSMQADGEDSVQYAELEQRYTQERTTLISPFLEHRQFERAAVLAEKYCDFGILVELCESGTGRKDRLQYYMDQFSNKGFSDFVFKYYIDRGQRGKLLTHFAHRPELSEFLQPHDHLGWLQDIHTNNYSQAQDTLRKLATRESFSVSKKKTLLSLGKLAALASDNDHQREIGEINAELDVITHHEQLPRDLIQKLNLNGDDLPCMTPQQLIELYISERNTNSNEYDFKKALDLLQYLHKEGSHYTDLMVRIWCRAILRDEWNEMQGVDPWDYIKDSIFFKTAAKALQEGLDLTECLPDPDTLMQHYELQGMRDNTRFEYLLRTGFEQIGRSLAAAE
ncbi:nuclear pore complex protein Nup133 isoform X2 [Strongylocentrotus purpuratus]|uniref:Nuclear pore complex protein Nup133 n=1 Tax=Strongylocentrotus purpuratus TaxID=7668 RepID=A0A7M7PUT5_STRPU|nr:nuclear pore complex protein Nup133 isoform X2 [Strongylocentrotus purpuratus]